MRRNRKRLRGSDIAAYLVLGIGGLAMIYPVVYVMLAALYSAQEFNTSQIGFIPWPKEPTFKNYASLFFASGDGWTLIYLRNSLFRTVYGTAFAVLTSLLSGYVFARLRFRGKRTVFLLVLSTQMIPTIVGTLPMYLEANFLKIYDTWGIYLLLNGGLINAMGMFFVKQSVEDMPVALEEVAKIDGAGTFRIIFSVVMPLIKTVLAYIAITTAIGIWNDWSTSFYYTDSRDLQVIASALSRLTAFAGQEGATINYPAILSFSLLLTVPSIVIFAIFQKWIVEGVAAAGIKG